MTGERDRPRGVTALALVLALGLIVAVLVAVTAGLVALWRLVL